MTTPAALPEHVETALATQRYLEALTVLDDDQVRRPSCLPGWSRAHVVAHLACNADALTAVVEQVAAGAPAYMYASQADRDADIERTAQRDTAGLRAATELACAQWDLAVSSVDPALLGVEVARTPGGTTFPLAAVGRMRRTEVEIHHADLELGYSAHDWPAEFTLRLIRRRQGELEAQDGGGPSMVLSSTDLPGLWRLGTGPGPTVEGAAADLAWWLVGRGQGDGLVCSAGELPRLGRWR